MTKMYHNQKDRNTLRGKGVLWQWCQRAVIGVIFPKMFKKNTWGRAFTLVEAKREWLADYQWMNHR